MKVPNPQMMMQRCLQMGKRMGLRGPALKAFVRKMMQRKAQQIKEERSREARKKKK